MLAGTSAAIAAVKAERDLLEDRLSQLEQTQPRAWLRQRDLKIKIEAVVAQLAALEAAARAEEAQLTEDDVADAVTVFGVVLAAGERDEVDLIKKQLRAMSVAELQASVDATRAARQALAGLSTVAAICDRRDHDTALKIADRVAAERGIELAAVTTAPTRAKERGRSR